MSLPRPPDYLPPPLPAVGDLARTTRVLLTDMVSHFARAALQTRITSLTTTTEEGLSRVRQAFAATVRRLGIALEVLHADRVPPAGGLVLMWNQESHLDHLVLPCALPRPFFSLFNNAVARTPIYGAHLRAAGHVHVDRTNERQWRAEIARAARRVCEGECVLVSPEGTRSWDGKLLPMKRGTFELAAASGRPIVCVTVIGGRERLARGTFFVRAGPMRIVFSEPLANDEDREALAARVAATFERVKAEYRL
jgi:1-acyl-sn-glycerol-3-phosphate acyltransferase